MLDATTDGSTQDTHAPDGTPPEVAVTDVTLDDGGVVNDAPVTGDHPPARCQADAIYVCLCADRANGLQRCLGDGGLEPCQCATDGGTTTLSLPPRLLSPVTASRVTSQRPTLRWVRPPGITRSRVELCRDRACTRSITQLEVAEESARPTEALPPGVVFWRVQGLRGDGSVAWTSATWEFWVGQRSAPVDTSYGLMKDFNGDGFDDLAVSTVQSRPVGIVEVFNGAAGGIDASSRRTLRVPRIGGYNFGDNLQPAGDLNGDGYADLVVGSTGSADETDMGGWVFHGSERGLPESASWVLPVEFRSYLILGAGGDVNGDGFCDIVAIFRGVEDSIQVFLGTSTGVQPTPLTLRNPNNRTTSVDFAGDLNSDGYEEIAVAAPTDLGSTGRVFLYLGGPVGPRPDYVEIYPRNVGSNSIGDIIAGRADFNGDGRHDFASSSVGNAFIFLGDTRIPSPERPTVIRGTEGGIGPPGYAFGVIIAYSDLNGDGLSDLAITQGGATGPSTPEYFGLGAVYIHYGNPAGVEPTPRSILRGPRYESAFGAGLSTASDFNRDGIDDLAVGAPHPLGDSSNGNVQIYLGRTGGLSPLHDQRIPWLMPDLWGYFGLHVALLDPSSRPRATARLTQRHL